jgi:hypothetical protein
LETTHNSQKGTGRFSGKLAKIRQERMIEKVLIETS